MFLADYLDHLLNLDQNNQFYNRMYDSHHQYLFDKLCHPKFQLEVEDIQLNHRIRSDPLPNQAFHLADLDQRYHLRKEHPFQLCRNQQFLLQ